MKINKLLFLTAFFMGTILNGQDTIYYNDSDVVNSLEDATWFEIIYKDEFDSNLVNVKEYFKSGNIKRNLYYSDYANYERDGNQKEWFESGQLLLDMNYDHGKKHGELLTYWEDGKSKRIDFYENDSLISGQCFDADGNEIPHFPFLITPEFPGGIQELMNYLVRHTRYPRKSRNKGIQGTVILLFVITDEGMVSNVKIIQNLSEELDEEAMRVVRNMPRWTPGKIDGEVSSVFYYLPIKFTLR